jgi:hypothetical protein
MECDFCSSPAVVTRFECCDFNSSSSDAGIIYPTTRINPGPTDLVLESHSFWAACAPCAALVEAQDIDGLLAHVIEVFTKRGYVLGANVKVHMRRTYQLFFANRIRVSVR